MEKSDDIRRGIHIAKKIPVADDGILETKFGRWRHFDKPFFPPM